MTQVNLLPSDVRQRQRTKRLTLLVIGGAGAALGLLFLVFVLQTARLSNAQRELTVQQSQNNALQSKIAGLERFQQLKQSVADGEALVGEVTQGQVMWSGVLKDVSSVIPGQMWLTGMTGTLSGSPVGAQSPAPGAAPAGATATTILPGSGVVGNIQFTGVAFDHTTVALWLTRLEEVKGWVNPWINSSTKGSASGGPTLVNFTGSVDLTAGATVSGGAQ